MAFPVTYNISYYRGDSHEFVLYPQNSDGTAYDLTGAEAIFVIANQLADNPSWSANGDIDVDATNGLIKCTIFPDIGNQLVAGNTYYYDVEIRKTVSGKLYVFTLLNGTISVTQGVNQHV